MKTTQYTGLTVRFLLVWLAAAACHSLAAQSEIPIRLVNSNLIVVSLTSGQEGPFDFVLDTGAETTVVDPSIVARLSFVSVDRVRQTTLSGAQMLDRGVIRSLSAGPAKVENLCVLVQDMAQLRKLDPRIVGIAGQNFLSHFNYLLDYSHRHLRIELGGEIEDSIHGDHVPIVIKGNRMLVGSIAQSGSDTSLHLMLDSGANLVVLLRPASQLLNLAVAKNVAMMTVSGHAEVPVSRIPTLVVGTQEFRGVAAMLSSVKTEDGLGDGLLPTSLFQTLYVNNRDKFVVFNPRIKSNAHGR